MHAGAERHRPLDRRVRRRAPRVVAALLLAGPLCLATPPVHADMTTDQPTVQSDKVATLSVRGRAELRVPADRANLSIAVQTEHADPTRALQLNSDAMNRVIEAVREAGLDESELETGRFFIRPAYSRRPRTAGDDWRPQIIGYDVTNALTIRTLKLHLVGDIVEAANKAGANNVSVTGFDLSNPHVHRRTAIMSATQRAMDEAAALAQAAELELDRIVQVTLDPAETMPTEMAFTAGARMAADMGGPPIVAGDVTLSATVHIIYEIRNRPR